MTKQKEKKKVSIVKKMMIAVVAGFVVGFICLLIKSAVMGTDGEGAWKVVEAILFQDITATKDIEGLGLFYIVGQLFMKGLQMMIVPLVLCSLTLALCSLANPKKLGRIAGKTFVSYLCFYIVAAALAGAAAYLAKSLGWFTVNLPAQQAQDIVTMEGYNPLVTIVNAVPSNMINAMSSNNTILCVVVIAIIFGLCMTKMGEKADPLKKVFENINDIVQMFLNFLINKIAPIAIFCMIVRALAVYGIEYISPTMMWIVVTIVVSLLLVCTIYPIGIFITTGLNPFIFLKKAAKIGMFAAATNSSAATLPLNKETCINRTRLFRRNQQLCSSDRYDNQYERYNRNAYDRHYIHRHSRRRQHYSCNPLSYSIPLNLHGSRYSGNPCCRHNNGLCCNDGTWLELRSLYDWLLAYSCHELPPGYGCYHT